MTTYQAGQLRHRVTVQRLNREYTGTRGEATSSFVDLESRYAMFEYLSGTELEQARKVYSETSARVSMRKPMAYTLTKKDRIKYQGVVYGIGSIVPAGDNFQDLQILLSEVT